MDRCDTHRDGEASGICRSCRRAFCDSCLVYSYGGAKPPYCVRCALIAAGTTPSPGWIPDISVSA
jgi:hypothetical protein